MGRLFKRGRSPGTAFQHDTLRMDGNQPNYYIIEGVEFESKRKSRSLNRKSHIPLWLIAIDYKYIYMYT